MEDSLGKKEKHRNFSLKKSERLCSRKQLEKLFSVGTTFSAYPLRVVYSDYDFPEPYPAKAAFACLLYTSMVGNILFL